MTTTSQWNPIATAPKDSPNIWLSNGFSIRIGYWREGDGWTDYHKREAREPNSSLGWEPTHWMPIPDPPGSVKRRTDQQRKAIEVYCRELATALNDAGCDQRKVLAAMKEGVEIPWSQQTVKDSLFRPVQVAVVEKQSTTQLTKDEVSEVYEILNRWTAQTFGVSVPFPERDA